MQIAKLINNSYYMHLNQYLKLREHFKAHLMRYYENRLRNDNYCFYNGNNNIDRHVFKGQETNNFLLHQDFGYIYIY